MSKEDNSQDIRKKLLRKPIEDSLQEVFSIPDLIDYYSRMGGFTATMIARAVDYLFQMLSDTDCKIIMSFTANLVATGLRSVIADFISKGYVDVIITTGGTFDHDIARSIGGKYFQGTFEVDDRMLARLKIHRLGNVFIPYENYGVLVEEFTHALFEELYSEKRIWSPSEIAREVGKRIKDDNSILRKAYEMNVPVFAPGIVDSAFGMSIFTYNEKLSLQSRKEKIVIDVLSDMKKISEIIFSSKKLGGIVLGGGISKHHLIWWSQFKGGLSYAIYITTAPEWDGSLSGAKTREAITWGKINPEAKHVTVYGDATVVFPLIVFCVTSRMRGKKRR